MSWAHTEEEAAAIAHDQWRSNVFADPVAADTSSVRAFDAMSEHVQPAAVHVPVRVSADLGRHRAWIEEYLDVGFDDIYLHHVGQRQQEFIDTFGEHVLPAVASGRD